MSEEIVGSSGPLQKVLAQVRKVAAADCTVLILGETGTGKELIARAIHKRSKRAARAFIGVNCGAIPASLVASELFGHEKGAFTGATQRRLGRFEAANGGTIFLDEVGDLPPDIQIALLRVLQEREIERVGSDQSLPILVCKRARRIRKRSTERRVPLLPTPSIQRAGGLAARPGPCPIVVNRSQNLTAVGGTKCACRCRMGRAGTSNQGWDSR